VLDQRQLATEATIHLTEFKSDEATAEDDEVWREKIDVHHRAVREVGNSIKAGNWGDYSARADIDKDAIGSEIGAIYCDFLFRDKAGVTLIYSATFQRL
jgi:hypothetical protein